MFLTNKFNEFKFFLLAAHLKTCTIMDKAEIQCKVQV